MRAALLQVAGGVCVVAGIAMVATWLAFVVGGVALVLAAEVVDRQ